MGVYREPAGVTPTRRPAAFATTALQVGVGVVLVAGVVTWNPAVVVNAAFGLAVTYLPAVLARDLRLRLSPGLTLLVALAVFLHAVGMTGFYGTTWWWDKLTHALSAAVVTSVAFAFVAALDAHRDDLVFPPAFLAVFLLACTLAFGVLWETLEFGARHLGYAFGVEPVLVVYGIADPFRDLVFDLVGGVVAMAAGTKYLRGDVASVTAWLRDW